ncbi:MAG: MBL fold metallo-hydrolase [Vicinamibacterales bacterium]
MKTSSALVVACLLLASVAWAQRGPAPDPFVPEGVTVRLGPHTYAIPDGDIGGVPNVGIVVGERATLVIDPGLGRRNGEAILREVAKVSANAELYIVSTHFHPEHTTGYVAFPPTATYINSREQEAEFTTDGQRMIDVFAGRTPVMGDLLRDARRREADITYSGSYRLDLGGVAVRMLVVGPTHTRGDTGFFVEGDGVLFAGDVVMNQSFVAANPTSSLTAWLAAFDAFEAMRPQRIVPAHGAIGDASLIPTLRGILQDIRLRARALKAAGRSADDTATTVQMEMQAAHPGWPRANGVAALARVAWNEVP